jgi:hypothetical protein
LLYNIRIPTSSLKELVLLGGVLDELAVSNMSGLVKLTLEGERAIVLNFKKLGGLTHLVMRKLGKAWCPSTAFLSQLPNLTHLTIGQAEGSGISFKNYSPLPLNHKIVYLESDTKSIFESYTGRIKFVGNNGGYYEGYAINGRSNGKGALVDDDAIYFGEWVNDRLPRGLITYRNSGCTYEGEIVYSSAIGFVPHGEGVLRGNDGQEWRGRFEYGIVCYK